MRTRAGAEHELPGRDACGDLRGCVKHDVVRCAGQSSEGVKAVPRPTIERECDGACDVAYVVGALRMAARLREAVEGEKQLKNSHPS